MVNLLPGIRGATPRENDPTPTRLALVATPVVANTVLCLNRVEGPRPMSAGILGQEQDRRGSWLHWEGLGAGVTPGGFRGYVRRGLWLQPHQERSRPGPHQEELGAVSGGAWIWDPMPCPRSPPRGHHPPEEALRSHPCGPGPQWTGQAALQPFLERREEGVGLGQAQGLTDAERVLSPPGPALAPQSHS